MVLFILKCILLCTSIEQPGLARSIHRCQFGRKHSDAVGPDSAVHCRLQMHCLVSLLISVVSKPDAFLLLHISSMLHLVVFRNLVYVFF